MFFIPGWLLSILTFPGVMVHEAAHRLFCDLAKVPVYEVCYFRVGNPAGYVIHGHSPTLRQAFLISVGPLIVNTILCSLITFAAVPQLFFLADHSFSLPVYALAWMGLSIGMHAFPSNTDMKNFVDQMHLAAYKGPFYYLGRLFQGLIYLANGLRIVWFDAFYAAGVALLLPFLLTRT